MTLQSLFKTRSGQARSEELPQASPEALQPTVLIVDDEPGILGALKRVLHHEPYRVLTTTNPMEAFHLLATHSVQMVISDQRMPEMTGTELLLQVKLLYPDVVRVILTGYTDEEAIMAAINCNTTEHIEDQRAHESVSQVHPAVQQAYYHAAPVRDHP
jgi:DNA-binding NtrC family response regulator